MKKITALFLSILIIVLSLFSSSAITLYDLFQNNSDSDWSYSVKDGCAEITGCQTTSNNIYIPEEIDGYTVTSIGSAAFYNSDLEKIVLPGTIKSIGWWAFYGCKNLDEVELNVGLNTINYGAFMNCPSLKTISVPYTVISIGEDAFAVNCTTYSGVLDYSSNSTVSSQYYYCDSSFILNGYSSTVSQQYALSNNLIFENKGDILLCDSDLNGKVNNDDIVLLKKYINGEINFSDKQIINCDVDSDAEVTNSDLKLIEKYVLNKIPIGSLPVAAFLTEEPDYLYGKTMYCDGDSISKGTGTNIFGSDYYSYCNFIADKYDMTMVNNAVAGTTLAKQKNKTKKSNKSIVERVESMTGDYYVILLNGGFNDLFQKIELGEMTEENDKYGVYDEYTTAGALESICYFLNKNYPDAIKAFVLCHKRNANPNQDKYWNMISDILEKWNIDCIDISKETDFCDVNDEISTQYFRYNENMKKGDGIHPLEYAVRKIYGPIVSQKLNEIAGKNLSINFKKEYIELGACESYYQSPYFNKYADNISLLWSSDNPEVAQVTQSGQIIAKGLGKTNINVCLSDGKTASYTVNVKFMAIDVDLDANSLVLSTGQTHNLKTSFLEGTASYHNTFISSDSSVASVSEESGKITAIKSGKAVITCKTPLGAVAECSVTVS